MNVRKISARILRHGTIFRIALGGSHGWLRMRRKTTWMFMFEFFFFSSILERQSFSSKGFAWHDHNTCNFIQVNRHCWKRVSPRRWAALWTVRTWRWRRPRCLVRVATTCCSQRRASWRGRPPHASASSGHKELQTHQKIKEKKIIVHLEKKKILNNFEGKQWMLNEAQISVWHFNVRPALSARFCCWLAISAGIRSVKEAGITSMGFSSLSRLILALNQPWYYGFGGRGELLWSFRSPPPPRFSR